MSVIFDACADEIHPVYFPWSGMIGPYSAGCETAGLSQLSQLDSPMPAVRVLDSYIVGNRHLLKQGEGILSERIFADRKVDGFNHPSGYMTDNISFRRVMSSKYACAASTSRQLDFHDGVTHLLPTSKNQGNGRRCSSTSWAAVHIPAGSYSAIASSLVCRDSLISA
ncbi:hypothetical protein PENFLA_c018G04528 [Penicillium flavigenum]|uniref:Uncharacterized protein n=1 Tax=Penicillium flavigenum TaxID=254877 RepID=A0A1V6T0U1_9EURO|nr:hypothetical protein PENFLA_c018G04528 [Penicillium flavigenum]